MVGYDQSQGYGDEHDRWRVSGGSNAQGVTRQARARLHVI